MERFIKLSKNDFIGRQKAAEEFEKGPAAKRVCLEIDAMDTDVMGDEPVWARVGNADYGLVTPPHGYGAPRFDAGGVETPKHDPQRDGEWRVVGWVTSGGYGHHVGLSLAQAYIPNALAENTGEDLFEVEILGHRFPARILPSPPFDPSGERMRG